MSKKKVTIQEVHAKAVELRQLTGLPFYAVAVGYGNAKLVVKTDREGSPNFKGANARDVLAPTKPATLLERMEALKVGAGYGFAGAARFNASRVMSRPFPQFVSFCEACGWAVCEATNGVFVDETHAHECPNR